MNKLKKAYFFINHLKKSLSNHDLITFQEEIQAIDKILEERNKIIKALRDIKEQYDSDFSEDELIEFFEKEPREETIYNILTRTLKEIDD